MIAVAIDQILRLAPSISGPIEPVVSSTNATSTTGLRPAGVGRRETTARARKASAAGLRNVAKHGHSPPATPSGAEMFPGFATGSGRNCGGPSADSR